MHFKSERGLWVPAGSGTWREACNNVSSCSRDKIKCSSRCELIRMPFCNRWEIQQVINIFLIRMWANFVIIHFCYWAKHRKAPANFWNIRSILVNAQQVRVFWCFTFILSLNDLRMIALFYTKFNSLDRFPTCSSSISVGVAIGSLITMFHSSVPLGGNITRQQETEDLLLVGNLHKKTANDAIRELQMYIDLKDSIK